MIETIPMEGMKVSGDLVLVEGRGSSSATGERLSGFLSGLAEAGINMNLFIGGEDGGRDPVRRAVWLLRTKDASKR